ncbi:kinase-like domain-containing protein [Pisolithus orientalis]|uniref:kinase-like domain-containing protein n=1 Tax=Pisolithus orientalis TaxID=936130 RepID=UPI0022242DC9|nr:kinase-like domain-containing protein [Pisolithus orientalis]KAI6035228.1 kinase-like domain-containing protein [Pisolithus orientalis]
MPSETAIANTAALAGSLLVSSATLAAQASPVPWLGAAFAVLTILKDMILAARANKNALKQLQDRCTAFLHVIQLKGMEAPLEEQKQLALDAERTVTQIVGHMSPWCSMSPVKLFVKQDELASEIQDCHTAINDCMTKLQINAALETRGWQVLLQSNMERDKIEMMQYLSDIKNTQSIILLALEEQRTDINTIMHVMQQNLSVANHENNRGLETNLYHLQKSSKTLLPNMNFKRGEVHRVGQDPIGGTHTMDIWEGIYLNQETVTLKVIRSIHASPKSLARLKREVEIWKRVWEVDRGHHILPLYGFCQNDTPFPYIVSPYMPNGTADKYVNDHPSVDHRALIKHICEGVNVLHNMVPPIVHGDIRGVNIVINESGDPLLADFGFSRIVQDLTGVAITESCGMLDSYRWAARELLVGGNLTLKADVYAFGMTVLELMSHREPWSQVRFPFHVVAKVSDGERPLRPSDKETVSRGLDDRLWELLESCWEEFENRPTMSEVLRKL